MFVNKNKNDSPVVINKINARGSFSSKKGSFNTVNKILVDLN